MNLFLRIVLMLIAAGSSGCVGYFSAELYFRHPESAVIVAVLFSLGGAVLSLLSSRFIKKPLSTLLCYLAVSISAVAVFLVCDALELPVNTVSIHALTAAETENCGEVWLTEASSGHGSISVKDLSISANSGWVYAEEYDDYVCYQGSGQDDNVLQIQWVNDDLELTFAKNAWSGTVKLEYNGEETVLALNEASDTDKTSQLFSGCVKTVQICVVCAMVIFAILLLPAAAYTLRKVSFVPSFANLAWCVLYTAVSWSLFFTSSQISPGTATKFLLMVFSISSGIVICSDSGRAVLHKYGNVSSRIWIGVISFGASLMCFVQRFFLDGNTRMHFSQVGLIYCLLGAVWFVPVVLAILALFELAVPYMEEREKRTHRVCACCCIYAVLLAINGIVLYTQWPGNFPVDSINQIAQTMGIVEYVDWHPFIHTLMIKTVLSVINEPGIITALRLIIASALLTAYLMILYDKGVSAWILAAVGAAFELLPNQVYNMVLCEKDEPFTLAVIWGIYLLTKIYVCRGEKLKWHFAVALGIDMFLVCTLRQNGIVPYAAMAILCIVLTFKLYGSIRLKAAAALVISLLSCFVYKGPVFDYFKVEKNPVSPYTTMLCAVASCINKELPLSDESMDIMEEVIPAEDWAAYYSRYVGHDPYYWGRPDGSVEYDTSSITASKAFKVYFEALQKYPDVVIKDRLDGADIMWDVVQPEDGSNMRGFPFICYLTDELPFDYDSMTKGSEGEYYSKNTVANLYRNALNTDIHGILDILLWRTGAYLIVFFVLILFWIKNGMGRIFWASLPMCANILALMLVLYHQSFRYVYFIQLGVLAMLVITVGAYRQMASPEKEI